MLSSALYKMRAPLPHRVEMLLLGFAADLVKKLEQSLGKLKQVEALVIRRSFPLISLSFLSNLRHVTGNEKYLYKLYVLTWKSCHSFRRCVY